MTQYINNHADLRIFDADKIKTFVVSVIKIEYLINIKRVEGVTQNYNLSEGNIQNVKMIFKMA